jgi:two-component system, LytTR family, response regulator
LIVKSKGRLHFVRVADIDSIEGARNYARLHVGKEEHPLRRSRRELSKYLDPDQFVRIRRSTIVNVDCIREMQPWFSGDYVAILNSGERLKMTRNHRQLLEGNPLWGGDAPQGDSEP